MKSRRGEKMKVVEKTFNSNSVNEEGFKSLCASIDKSLKGLSPKEFVELEPTDFEEIDRKPYCYKCKNHISVIDVEL